MSVGILAFRAEEDVLRVPKRSVDLIGAEGSLLSSWLLRDCLLPSIAYRHCCEDEEVGLFNRVLVTVASRPCLRGNRLWMQKWPHRAWHVCGAHNYTAKKTRHCVPLHPSAYDMRPWAKPFSLRFLKHLNDLFTPLKPTAHRPQTRPREHSNWRAGSLQAIRGELRTRGPTHGLKKQSATARQQTATASLPRSHTDKRGKKRGTETTGHPGQLTRPCGTASPGRSISGGTSVIEPQEKLFPCCWRRWRLKEKSTVIFPLVELSSCLPVVASSSGVGCRFVLCGQIESTLWCIWHRIVHVMIVCSRL